MIPFNRPEVTDLELDHVREAMTSGHTSTGGPFSDRAASLLQQATGAQGVLLTTSCTDALEMVSLMLDLQPGDTVVVPSFTFTSTALAFARQGARILFCDIEPETLGMDPRHLAELLDDSVRAVVLVHYAGVASDVEGVRAVLAERPDVTLVEDAAHGLYGAWRGAPLGSLGRFGTLSFHDTKNFVCGEGGALLLNDERDVARARVLWDKGTDRQAFLQGEVDKYSWRDTGSSFGLSEVLAAFLVAQLERAESIQARRRAVFEAYVDALASPAAGLGIRLPVVPDGADPAWHLFHVLLPDAAMRAPVMARMREAGVATASHYVPLHSSDGGRRFAAGSTQCPVTTDVSGRLLRLPFFNTLAEADVAHVAESLVAAVRAAS